MSIQVNNIRKTFGAFTALDSVTMKVEPGTVQLVSLPDGDGAGLNRLYLRQGRLPDPQSAREIAVSEGFAKAHALGPGDTLQFNMVLIGQALEQLALVVFALQRALERGLGHHRVPLALQQVDWLDADGQPHVVEAHNKHGRVAAGMGARRNGLALTVSDRRKLSGARVPTDALPEVDGDLTRVHKPNSIALRMAMVAAAEADLLATFRWGNEWDIAASTLIAREAGASVTDALGQPLMFNRPTPTALGVLCCAPGIHDAAIDRLSDRAQAALRKG